MPNLILIAGTPGVGKSRLAAKLSKHLDCRHVDISTLVREKRLYSRVDKKRGTLVADNNRLRLTMDMIIRASKNGPLIISTHYLQGYLPTRRVRVCFVLRLNPEKLRHRLRSRHWPLPKIRENVEAELIGVCQLEAIGLFGQRRVYEIDTTGKSSNKVLREVIAVLTHKKREIGNVGVVDWLQDYDPKNVGEEIG